MQTIISHFKERLFGRHEESLHESLQEAMARIVPTMVPFLNTGHLQVQLAVCYCMYVQSCVCPLSILYWYTTEHRFHDCRGRDILDLQYFLCLLVAAESVWVHAVP